MDKKIGYIRYYYLNLSGFLQDHQGNNCVVIDQTGEIEEINHYYPFGGTFASSSSIQPYKYNDKELDTKNGQNWYDYGARHSDVENAGTNTHYVFGRSNGKVYIYTSSGV